MDQRFPAIRRSLPLAVAIVALDLASKSGASRELDPRGGGSDRWLWENRLGISYGENAGIAFGLLRWVDAAILAVAALLLLLIVVWLVWSHRHDVLVVIGGTAVAAGAAGNLIDRIRFGHVRDFIVVGPWPAFNVADVAVTLGAAALLIAFARPAASFGALAPRSNHSASSRSTVIEAPE